MRTFRQDVVKAGSRRRGRWSHLLVCAVLVVSVATVAQGKILDLTVGGADLPGDFINGAFYLATEIEGAAGTGLWDSFVRIDRTPPPPEYLEEGYNTSSRDVRYDENTDPNFTRDLQLFEVRIVNFTAPGEADPVSYYEFLLDINEPKGGGKNLLSLDDVQILLSDAPIPDPGGGTVPTIEALIADPAYSLVYDMDAAPDGESAVKLDFKLLGSGSGRGDMTLLVPVAVLGDKPINGNKYVTLYSHFGGLVDPPEEWTAADGFEEWAVRDGVIDEQTITPIPEPVSMALCGSAIFGVAGYARKRIREKKA